jgi:hypothetical protein
LDERNFTVKNKAEALQEQKRKAGIDPEEAKKKASPDDLSDIECHYDCAGKNYWLKNSRGKWIPATETHVRRELKILGYRDWDLNRKLSEIHLSRDVKFAGAVAGHRTGILKSADGDILVTSEPKLIDPVKGEWPTIREFLESLFSEYNQIDYVYSWLKCSVQALRDGRLSAPAQALVIVGESSDGKSCFQYAIVTDLLGGRHAPPNRYINGNEFNGALTEAEHLLCEDPVPRTDMRSRLHLGSKVKEIVANETQSSHSKGKQEVKVNPFWRLTITMNSETENLMLLPPMSSDLENKIILLKSTRATNLPDGDEGKAEFGRMIKSELPAFAHFLLNEYEIPESIKCPKGRYGVTHFHHPELIAHLHESSPESRLDIIIQSVLFSKDGASPYDDKWTGKAIDLERKLRDSPTWSHEVGQITRYHNAFGKYLARLTKNDKSKDRYSVRTIKGHSVYTITKDPVVVTDKVPF